MTRYDPNVTDPKYGPQIPAGNPPAGHCDGCGCRMFPLPDETPEGMPDTCENC